MIRRVLEFSLVQVFAQAISVGALLVLAVSVAPETLALYGVAIGVGSIVGANAALRIELAVLSADRSDRAPIASAAIVLGLGPLALSLALVPWQSTSHIAAGLAYGSFLSVSGTLQAYLISDNRSRAASLILLFRTLLVSGSVVGAGLYGSSSPYRLVSVLTLVAFCGTTVVGLYAVLQIGFQKLKSAFETTHAYADVWKPLIGQSVLSSISLNVPYFIVASFYPAGLAAAFLLAEKCVKLPITLVSYSARSHLIGYFKQVKSGKIPILGGIFRSSLIISSSSFTVIVVTSAILFALPVQLTAASLEDVALAISLMALWASLSVALPISAAFLQANGRSSYLFKNQLREFALKFFALAVIAVVNPNYYIAVALIYASPAIANMNVIFTASRHQKRSAQ